MSDVVDAKLAVKLAPVSARLYGIVADMENYEAFLACVVCMRLVLNGMPPEMASQIEPKMMSYLFPTGAVWPEHSNE